MSIHFITIAYILAAFSGLPGLLLKRGSLTAQRIAVALMSAGAVTGIYGAFSVMCFNNSSEMLPFPWLNMGSCYTGVDGLSAFFLIPVFLMGTLGSIYGLGYWAHDRHPSNSRKLTLFWGLLVAGMALLVVSKHAMAFLLGWEIMALSAFFLVSTEDDNHECRDAGWIYLIATHIGTLVLFAMFTLWKLSTGSWMLQTIEGHHMSFALMNGFFFLALIGFGLKAGIMPLHFWLPAAHATSPSHVSAMLSGVVLKMGIYGLVRWLSLFPNPPYAWGSILLILGFVSGLLGVVFALAQHDLKRLLAYHSVENIGIILMGLGIAMLGRAGNQPVLIVLGMSGCLLHVWNHSFFKSLLFLCAGSVIHSTHTRQIDQMGGLSKMMPWTALFFLIGAVAICGLPPLNGFISELFVYLGLFRIVAEYPSGLIAATSVIVLAMVGALATACFVKVYGAVFLGHARSEPTRHFHESPVTMRIPMILLGTLCVIIGMAPMLFTGILAQAVSVWSGIANVSWCDPGTVAPLSKISLLAVSLVLVSLLIVVVIRILKIGTTEAGTWDCGYAMPSRKMQYTASSFAHSIVTMFNWVVHPREHKPHLTNTFPDSATYSSHVNELVLDRLLFPLGNFVKHCSGWFHRFQQGLIQHYILYILIALFLMLFAQMPIRELISKWFVH
jgi:hydrogenase-4 component B